MPDNKRLNHKNRLLRDMDVGDFRRLEEHLEPYELRLRERLECRQSPIDHVYFIEIGLGSIVAKVSRGRDAEVGVIGFEGMTGSSLVLGDNRSPHECNVQIVGNSFRLPAEVLTDALAQSETLRPFLLRYVQALLVQTSYTTLANARARVEERLARWLLMCHDRVEGDVVTITHESLSIMLGVRRPGVTVALQMLEGKGLIRSTRGVVTMRDRPGLESVADGIYGEPEAEYARLMKWAPPDRRLDSPVVARAGMDA